MFNIFLVNLFYLMISDFYKHFRFIEKIDNKSVPTSFRKFKITERKGFHNHRYELVRRK